MLTRKELEDLVNIPDHKLDKYELMGKRSAFSRGLPYYGKLRSKFPIHFTSFADMHTRHKTKGVEISETFSRDVDGFINFLLYLGDLNTEYDTLGRKDHSKGYIEGNFKWEPYWENYSEAALRNVKTNTYHINFIKSYNEIIKKFYQLQNQIIVVDDLYEQFGKNTESTQKKFNYVLKELDFIQLPNPERISYRDEVVINEFDIDKYLK